MSKPASPWDGLIDESEQQHLVSFNQRMAIGFYKFFNLYFHLFSFFAFTKLGEKTVCDKIVIDSFTIIWTGKMTFKTSDDLKYYLLIIVRNKCNRHYRNARNEACDLEADKLFLDRLEMFLEKYYKISPQKMISLKR